MNAFLREILKMAMEAENSTASPSQNPGGYKIVRTRGAGVFAGYVASRTGSEVVMNDARRLWYWKGAASLSELAVKGTKCPGECKFPTAVPRVELLDAVEILDVTPEAEASIKGVPVWVA
jgi:hypothetical protein